MSLCRSVFARRVLYSLILGALIWAAQPATAIAQSTDQSNPTVLSSNEILGQGTDSKTDYFYAFSAEPGKVMLTIDVKADSKATVPGFDYEILDSKSKRLAAGTLDPVGGASKRVVDSINVQGPGTQQLILKLTITQSVEAYRVQLGGSVAVASAASGTSGTVGGAVSQSAAPVPQPVVPAPQPTPVAAADPAASQSIPARLLNFEFGSDNKTQMLKDIPATGTLILEMKDGTTREILLKDVKTLTVKSQ